MTKILNSLRSPGAMMIALVLALFPQGEHTAQVFMFFSHDASANAQLFAYAFAAAVEVAVLLFVLAGHKGISYTFAAASFATNMVYYAIGGVALLSAAVWPVLLLSALLPGCIMGYSHTIASHTTATPAQPPAQSPRRTWRWWRKSDATDATTNASDTQPAQPGAAIAQPGAIPAPQPAQPDASDTQPAQPAPQPDAKPTKAQRLAQIESAELFDPAQVSAQFNVSRRTAQLDIAQVRAGMTQSNGKVQHA